MVNIPLRGADPFLVPADVEDGDIVTILKEPYIQDAEKTKFHKERTVISVLVQRTKEICRWGLNTTSNDRLVKAFGSDGFQWIGKQVRIKMQEMNVSGVNKSVLYAVPSVQTKVAPAEQQAEA
jgi:hypothetical protein